MNYSISQSCTMPATFAADVMGYTDGGCTAIEVWLTKLERHLATSTIDETRALLVDRGVTLVAAAYQGGLLLSQGEARKATFDHFKTRLDLCQQFAIPTMVVVADFAQTIDETSLGRAVVSLSQAAQWAAGFDVRLALEFRGADTFCSCLETAILLVEQCDEPNVGVCLDVFQYYKGASKFEDLDRLTAQTLAHVHLCDIPGIPREIMTDADRVFPGEGDFQLIPILQKLKQIGYAGYASLEVMNPMIWQSKPSQVAELGMTALTRLLG